MLLCYIARVASLPNFYGQNAYEFGQVILNLFLSCFLLMFCFILILLLLLLRLMSGLNMPPSFHWVLHLRMRASTSMIFCRVVPFWSVTASQLQMLQSGLLLQVQPSETAYLYLFYSDIFKPPHGE